MSFNPAQQTPVLHGVTGQGEPYGVAGGGGLGLDAATDVVEMVVVLADNLAAYDMPEARVTNRSD